MLQNRIRSAVTEDEEEDQLKLNLVQRKPIFSYNPVIIFWPGITTYSECVFICTCECKLKTDF